MCVGTKNVNKRTQVNIKLIPYVNPHIYKFEVKISTMAWSIFSWKIASLSHINIKTREQLQTQSHKHPRFHGKTVSSWYSSSCCIGKWGNYQRFLRSYQKRSKLPVPKQGHNLPSLYVLLSIETCNHWMGDVK